MMMETYAWYKPHPGACEIDDIDSGILGYDWDKLGSKQRGVAHLAQCKETNDVRRTSVTQNANTLSM